MKIKDFDFYKEFLRKYAGLYLSSDQAYVLSSRLTLVAKEWGYVDLNHMTVDLARMPDKKLIHDVVEAMTDGETAFFRDTDFFNALKVDIIPDIIAKKSFDRTIKILCIGCSTGQEAYSLALLFKEKPLKDYLPTFKFFVDAKDISKRSLKKAKAGTYSQSDVQNGLPVTTLMEHFEQDDKHWTAKKQLKDHITFKHFNLIEDIRTLDTYDLILCRNVLQNFDHILKTSVLDDLSQKIQQNGYIAFGQDEEILQFTDTLSSVKDHADIYQVASK